MKKTCIVLFSLLICSQTHAGDLNFESTAEGITKALTKPKIEQKIKTRSLKGFNAVKTRSIKVVGKEQGKIVEKTITVTANQPVRGVNLKIEFNVNSYTIRPDSFSLLDELGLALTGEQLKGKPVIIKGHTDSDGDEVYNLELSLKRGLAVKSYLISNFPISPSYLRVAGYGEALPLVSNNSESNKQINRRVEIEASDL